MDIIHSGYFAALRIHVERAGRVSAEDNGAMTDNAQKVRPAVFHILLALAGEDMHGLGIADEVERATGGTVELGPGTLYRSLKEMHAGGLIEEVDAPGSDADPRRRYYRISPRGRVLLTEEATRLARVVDLARERSVVRGDA